MSFELFPQHSCKVVYHRPPKLPETGNNFSRSFFSKKNVRSFVKGAKWFLVYMNILTQSIAITDSMFNFGNLLTKNAITFDQKEIERKKKYLVGIKFCCASNAAIKNVKIARKKINFFPKIFLTKSTFKKKNTDF